MNATNASWESSSEILFNHTSNFTKKEKQYLHPTLYYLIFSVGFTGNALVVLIIIMGTKLKSMTDVCLLNLALADLFLVFSLPFRAYQLNQGWIFGKHMCTLVYGIYYIGYYSSIFFIVLMSIDRYLAIVHAVFALRVRTKIRGIVSCLVTWILAVVASFPELWNMGFTYNKNVLMCDTKNVHSFVSFKRNIVGLLVPLIIVGFCYSMILWKLRRSLSPKKQSIRLVVLVMLVFFFCWTPYNILEFMRGLTYWAGKPAFRKHIKPVLRIFRAVAFSHSCLNPFIYVFVGKRFRKYLTGLVRKCWSSCCSKGSRVQEFLSHTHSTTSSSIAH